MYAYFNVYLTINQSINQSININKINTIKSTNKFLRRPTCFELPQGRRKYVNIWRFSFLLDLQMPVPVAARSKASVCGLSSAEIVGSNPTGDMDVCLL